MLVIATVITVLNYSHCNYCIQLQHSCSTYFIGPESINGIIDRNSNSECKEGRNTVNRANDSVGLPALGGFC